MGFFGGGGAVILPLSIKMTCRFGLQDYRLQGLPMQPPCPAPLTVAYIESHSPK